MFGYSTELRSQTQGKGNQRKLFIENLLSNRWIHNGIRPLCTRWSLSPREDHLRLESGTRLDRSGEGEEEAVPKQEKIGNLKNLPQHFLSPTSKYPCCQVELYQSHADRIAEFQQICGCPLRLQAGQVFCVCRFPPSNWGIRQSMGKPECPSTLPVVKWREFGSWII